MNWLARLFSQNTLHEPNQPTEPLDGVVIRLDDQSYFANSDIIEGMQFSATLQIRTPLSVLRHHGEIFHGSPSNAPVYGSQADGIWVFRTKTFKELGIDMGEMSESTHASDIGPVLPSHYLPFLIQFRSIAESSSSPDQQMLALLELPKQSARFSEIWQKLCTSYNDFPSSFFYYPFTSLPGIGRKLARNLYAAGFRSTEEIINSSMAQLTAVPGLGSATAAKLTTVATAGRQGQ